jgi:hypothetical protein
MTEYSHLGNGAHGTKLERQQGDPAIKQCNPPGDWSSNDRRSAEYHQPARYKPFVAYQDHGYMHYYNACKEININKLYNVYQPLSKQF